MKKTKEIAGDIMDGRIGAFPFRNSAKTACDYCLYKAACGFENGKPGCAYNNLGKIDSIEYFL